MKEYVDSTAKDSAAKFRNRDEGGLLYFRPIALPQLVSAILETTFRTNVSLQDSMSAYSKLEMHISKEPWIKVLWDADSHTMIMKNKTLLRPLLMFMYGRDALYKKEIDSLKLRYAKILDVGETEIEDKLNALLV